MSANQRDSGLESAIDMSQEIGALRPGQKLPWSARNGTNVIPRRQRNQQQSSAACAWLSAGFFALSVGRSSSEAALLSTWRK